MLRKLPILVLSVCAIAAAEFSFGVDMNYTVSKNESETEYESGLEDRESESGNNNLSISPVFGIHANDIIEISPFFGYYFSSRNTKDKTSTSTIKTKWAQHGIFFGSGLYFHVVNNSDILDFSLGPKIYYRMSFTPDEGKDAPDYDTYIDGVFGAACQINIDLHFSNHFAARLSSSLYSFSVSHKKTEVEKSDITKKTVIKTSDFRTVFTPSLGFYFTF